MTGATPSPQNIDDRFITRNNTFSAVEIVERIASSGSPISAPTVTVADCSDTAIETTITTITVDNWENFQRLSIHQYIESGQHSGGDINFTLKIKVNGSSITLMNNVSVTDSETFGLSFRGFIMMRNGSNIVLSPGGSSGSDFMPNTAVITGASNFTADTFQGRIYEDVDFDNPVIVTMTAQWASADASAYFNVKSAKVILI